MQDKPRLLSLEEPTQFIFSHSAISEGWDNPNVFQICFLKEQGSIRRAKQELGRGLRLAVDASGKRITQNKKINTLTVITDVSRKEFIEQFKANLKEDCPNRKRLSLDWLKHSLNQTRDAYYLSEETFAPIREELVGILRGEQVVDGEDCIHPSQYSPSVKEKVHCFVESSSLSDVIKKALIDKLTSALDPSPKIEEGGKNKPTSTKQVQINEKILADPLFKNLWKRIKGKVYYHYLSLNSDKLLNKCKERILEELQNEKYQNVDYYTRRTESIQSVALDKLEDPSNLKSVDTKRYGRQEGILYQREHIIYQLADKTNLTDKTIAKLLMLISEKREDFWLLLYHDTSLVQSISDWVDDTFKTMILESGKIEYHKMEGSYYPASIIIDDLENKNQNGISEHLLVSLTGEVSDKSISNPIVLSENFQPEKQFIEKVRSNNGVYVFIKLPTKFKAPTPVGDYNPDWAVIEKSTEDGKERIRYLIKETKSTDLHSDKR